MAIHHIEDNEALEEVKAHEQGFLINVWPGIDAKYHNLEHLCWNTQNQLLVTDNYPTYWAETQEDLEQHPYPWGNEVLVPCSKCYPQRHR